MSALDHLSDSEKAALDPEVYASLGRIVAGAPVPEGSVVIDADSPKDFRRQWAALLYGEDETDSAADRSAAPGPTPDPGTSPA